MLFAETALVVTELVLSLASLSTYFWSHDFKAIAVVFIAGQLILYFLLVVAGIFADFLPASKKRRSN